ncbi:MAG: TIM barrel protein [Lachnospiraceae bacterium]|nr:TIM barrel protein [Lachnospiraceae bacterium]
MIFLSMNMYTQEQFEEVFHFTKQFPRLGLELFPLFNQEGFSELEKSYERKLKMFPISCHEQYYEAENSAVVGSKAYEKTDRFLDQTLAMCNRLDSRYIVFHYNNKAVEENENSVDGKPQMLERARKRLILVKEKAKLAGVPIVVENTGVPSHRNVLLDEKEFITECKKNRDKVLIDIGHAWCNRWNLSHVIEELKDQIVAYHIHNNDGIQDGHQRIHNGTGDFEQFTRDYLRFTPNADLVLEYAYNVRTDIEGIEADIQEMMLLQARA